MSPRTVLFFALTSGGSGYLFGATTGFADLVEKTVPGVVRVMTSKVTPSAGSEQTSIGFVAGGGATGAKGRRVSGEGSGVVVSNDGYIVTNQHVIENSVRTRVQFSDGREMDARVVAADAPIDLAVLKVEATGLQPLPFGDSSKVRIGELVLAIGNPFGVGTTVTQGIVSAMSPSRLGIAGDEDYIQTDAAVNPGNSGGPLLNINGELIGINTAILSTSGGSNGIGFALPANVAKAVMQELIEKGYVDRGFLGISLQPMNAQLAEALGDEMNDGAAIIADVAAESPASKAGLQKGDVVTGMNGRIVRDFNRLRLFIAESKPGTATQLVVNRDGVEKNFWVVLEKRPSPQTAAIPNASESATTEVLSGAAITNAPGSGALILAIDPNGDSAAAGLRPGDLIVAANRKPVTDAAGLQKLLASSEGKASLLEISRGGATFFFGFHKN